MVTFMVNRINNFVLLEIQCKTNSQGFAKIPLFVYKCRHEALFSFENTLKLVVYILTGVMITAKMKNMHI